ncbi:interleukin-18 [Anomaloglossus baeobatrachus]|uniref:interleukin-18 n=1 Tax=Anomaloglossus baeobatrachus TaxID=238106 RepID=UPI003F4F90F5
MDMTAEEIDFDIYDILDGILHFRDNLQTDAWRKSRRRIKASIENIFKQCLEAHPDDTDGGAAVFANPGSDRQRFELQIYQTTEMNDGLPVAFGIKCKDEKYYMCCTEDMRLYFKRGDLPNDIAGNSSDVIFFQKEFSDGDDGFKFQSSLKSGYYLAVSNEGGKQKLVLQQSQSLNERERFSINW